MVSNDLKAAVFGQECDTVFIMLLTISGEGVDTIRLCNDPLEDLPIAGVKGVISRGDEYIYLPIGVELPQQDDTGIAKARLSIDNIDRRLVTLVRAASTKLNVTMELVLSTDPDSVELSFPNFKFERAGYNALTVSGDISMEYYDLEPFPSGRFTPSKFSGMF